MQPITCIIPCHNGAATIRRAVQSALDAGCANVLVYDDASSDGSYGIVHSLERDTPLMVECIASPLARVGAATARNLLIERTDNTLLICLDADDTLHNIASLVEAWQPGTWVYGDHIETDGTQETYHKGVPIGSLRNKLVTGVTFLFHSDDWAIAGGFDSDFAYCEDYAFQCALTHTGAHGVYVPTPVYTRHLKPDGNERTVLAGQYWTFYREMARRKYASVFG